MTTTDGHVRDLRGHLTLVHPLPAGADVRMTESAQRALVALFDEGGPVAFLEDRHSGELLCFGLADLVPRNDDVLLAHVAGCPLYVDRSARRPSVPNGLLIDAAEDADGPVFTLWPRACGPTAATSNRW
jgi:hypothetical protein